MKIFHPVSVMCLARYLNSSNKLLKEKIIFGVKSSGDIPMYSLNKCKAEKKHYQFSLLN